MKSYLLLFLVFSLLLSFSSCEQCGSQANGALCPNGLCCSKYGWCGNTEIYCELPGCQSQCTPAPPAPTGDLSDIISRDQFYTMLLHMNDCPATGFYTYEAFITAAKSFPSFGTTGDLTTRKREVAAFFGQTSHQTNGGWSRAPDGPYTWGYCYKEQVVPSDRRFCDHDSVQWPCAPGQFYYGRGPMMLSWNYNYGPCGTDINVDLLNNPAIASTDPVISFKTAIWFWMTPQAPKPSCHDVITNQWQPSEADIEAGRLPGYGVITNIINNALQCNAADDENRISYYKRYCDEIFGVDPGSNLECNDSPFSQGDNVFLDAAI